ncbi:DoxX family protein [Shimia biformata]|uniref:DoxX family protein n=1 Tax=Shimia biformata TaxID=1294299 RepID=UPI00195266C4|nr:DoxX family protein [Shimia biformata]
MNTLLSLHNRAFSRIERSEWLLPTLARFVFCAVLLVYFWNSALTKVGDGFLGVFSPSAGAYAQIFPRAFEAVGYDTSQMSVLHWAVVVAGTLAEFILPAMILFGFLTRLAALGMIGFICVQSLTDLYGHRAIEHSATVGAWFDRIQDSAILDQRLFWIAILLVLVFKGAGPLSVDRFLKARSQAV